MPSLGSVPSHGEPPSLMTFERMVGYPSSPKQSRSTSLRSPSSPRQADECQGRPSASEWVDVEDKPRQRRKRRSVASSNTGKRTASTGLQRQRNETSEPNRFFPRLSRILETGDGAESLRSNRERPASSPRKHRANAGPLERRNHDDVSSVSRRSTRGRTGSSQHHRNPQLRVSPSLLSVLSTATGQSDKSSRSSSTITQKSYARRASQDQEDLSVVPPRPSAAAIYGRSPYSTVSHAGESKCPADATQHYDDDRSVLSCSTASSYQPSDAGSSEGPGTPSSRSTLPSPTSTRRASVSELRKKYDIVSGASAGSARGASRSPSASARSLQSPSISVVVEDDEENNFDPLASSEISCSTGCPSSCVDNAADWQMHQQEAYRHDYVAGSYRAPMQQYIEPNYVQHRSMSASSHSSEHAAWAIMLQQQQQQQHRYPSPEQPQEYSQSTPPMNIPVSHANYRPPAPNPPDLTRHTFVGYEKLALELAKADSSVKPLYRKFEYLNHRILLHLQDELCELEEELRTLDEIVAQTSPSLAPKAHPTASRRTETRHGSEIHHRRLDVLGRIFIKTEQYNRAMTSFRALCASSEPVERAHVDAFRDWLGEHQPLHEAETKFLDHHSDLIRAGKGGAASVATPPALDGFFSPSNLLVATLLLLCGMLGGCLLRS